MKCSCQNCRIERTGVKTKRGCLHKGFSFPHIRRVFSAQFANELVSIQPMTVPAASIFYMDYTYGSGSKDET